MLLVPLLVASLLCSQGDGLGSHVTFTAPAETVEKALVSLSQTAGVSLSVEGPIAKDIVVLRFQDVPLADALKNIARVTAAEWQPIPGSATPGLSSWTASRSAWSTRLK